MKKKTMKKKTTPKAAQRILGKPSKQEKFTKDQQFLIIQWLGEGLTTKEMNIRSAAEKPPFTVTSSESHYYRLTRQVEVEAARKQRESEAFNSGFALKENRIMALNQLGQKLFSELTDEAMGKLWLAMVKGIGSGPDFERIEYEEFNQAELNAFRNLLDDMAQETGGRVRRTDLTSKDKPIGSNGLDPKLWKQLSDDELEILERAAEILERDNASPTGPAQGDDPS